MRGPRRARAITSSLVGVGVVALAAMIASCSDPVHDNLVKSLGPEDPNVPTGEFHRAGQPCLACHGGEGPAQTQFAVAGTIFWHQTQDEIGVDQSIVSVIDSLGANPQIQTNCVGNFFIQNSEWPGGNGPAFPLRVNVYKGAYSQTMRDPMNRDGSCADCHFDPPNYNSVGHVWIVPNGVPTDPLPQDCPVSPQLVSGGGIGLQ